MVSLTIVSEDLGIGDLENYADWMLQNGWLGFADKILINNKEYFDNKKHGKMYLKLVREHL